uniref:CCHC-type domain-containing protein n=1 Tax=Ananas comosus var. bracteatus TaxID=296719 RepID=A0A6V7P516_ANACO|nr:unnamed protein product [Ananas comosus var. bracteatus]
MIVNAEGMLLMLRPQGDWKRKKAVKRVALADEVGRELLACKDLINGEESTLPEAGSPTARDAQNGVTAELHRGNGVGAADSPGDSWTSCVKRVGGRSKSVFTEARSFKEALLRGSGPQASKPPTRTQQSTTFWSTRFNKSKRGGGRCFRCLASDHWAADCRDPIKCIRCLRSGHRASSCKEKAGSTRNKMNRFLQRRERTPRVYVPYTQEFLQRREQRRNVVLADVIQPANLGPDPSTTIAEALARRFGATPRTSQYPGFGSGTLLFSSQNGCQRR